MNTNSKRKIPGRWGLAFLVAAIAVLPLWSFIAGGGVVSGQSSSAQPLETRSVFSPAHSTLGDAFRHFLGIRSTPEQPIAYSHQLHVNEVGLECTFCHDSVAVGPVARIPSIETCMFCHLGVATETPEIQLLTSYYDRFEEPPWQRVYGWPHESHVRFTHAPHIRAEVECATCHGDVSQMMTAERAVDHTMSFCVDCHTAREASNECITCHF